MRFRRTISYLLHKLAKKIESQIDVPPLAYRYLTLLQDYSPNQIENLFFSQTLETQIDGAIEFYEFIELMILMEMYQDKTIPEFTNIVKEVRTGVVSDPKDPKFGQNTQIVLPIICDKRRAEYREAFKFLDKQDLTDGVISKKDLLTAMKKYIF